MGHKALRSSFRNAIVVLCLVAVAMPGGTRLIEPDSLTTSTYGNFSTAPPLRGGEFMDANSLAQATRTAAARRNPIEGSIQYTSAAYVHVRWF